MGKLDKPSINGWFNHWLADNHLPSVLQDYLHPIYLPLAEWIVANRKPDSHSGIWLLGINGAQGSGKSTVSSILAALLHHQHNLNVAVLSIDDFYLTRQERVHLSETIHPLLMCRGVPGTHDLTLATQTLEKLRNASPAQTTALPRFNKAEDDRFTEQDWPIIKGRPDLVIFEGWCVGTQPQAAQNLVLPVNELEANEDSELIWRKFVNTALESTYREFFSTLDALIMLQAPSFDCVYNWRIKQEHHLKEQLSQNFSSLTKPVGSRIMSDGEIMRFIQHYQRLTQHNLVSLPSLCDLLIPLNKLQKPKEIIYAKNKPQ